MMNIKILRAISQAQIKTLAEQGDSPELFRAQVVGKILEDDLCFQKISFDEAVEVLTALGYTPDAARTEAKKLTK